MISGRGCLAVIVACIAGGYTGFCIGFIVLSVDAAWKGIFQPGYELQWGIFAGIFYACIAGAVGGVIGISRFRVYLFWLGFGALFLWLCWCVFEQVRGLDLVALDGLDKGGHGKVNAAEQVYKAVSVDQVGDASNRGHAVCGG